MYALCLWCVYNVLFDPFFSAKFSLETASLTTCRLSFLSMYLYTKTYICASIHVPEL